MVEHFLHRLHGHTVSCTVLGIAMRAPELVAGGKQPVAVAGTRNSAGALRRPLERFPEAVEAIVQGAHGLRKPVTNLDATVVEAWARPDKVS